MKQENTIKVTLDEADSGLYTIFMTRLRHSISQHTGISLTHAIKQGDAHERTSAVISHSNKTTKAKLTF